MLLLRKVTAGLQTRKSTVKGEEGQAVREQEEKLKQTNKEKNSDILCMYIYICGWGGGGGGVLDFPDMLSGFAC